jgi:hypothetical protein
MEKMIEWIKAWLVNWITNLWKKIKERPFENISILIVLLLIIPKLGNTILTISLISTISYYIACIYGITKLIDDPRRAVTWCVGYIIGAMAFRLVVDNVLPMFRFNDLIASIGALVVFVVAVEFYTKSQELKKS